METKYILKEINNFSEIINNIIKTEKLSDNVKDILQILSLSSHWVYYNIIFAEENIKDWKEDGQLIKSLKEEFKKSLEIPDYRISKIKMDKSLIYIYSHYYIIIDSGSRISFPALKLELNEKFIENLYKRPYGCLNDNKNSIKLENDTIQKIKEVRNFRDNLIHYHTWFSTVIPSENIGILTSKLYREKNKGINFWEEGTDIIFTIRDFGSNSFEIEKYGRNYKKNELIDLKQMLNEDFETVKIFINNIVITSTANFKEWFKKIKENF